MNVILSHRLYFTCIQPLQLQTNRLLLYQSVPPTISHAFSIRQISTFVQYLTKTISRRGFSQYLIFHLKICNSFRTNIFIQKFTYLHELLLIYFPQLITSRILFLQQKRPPFFYKHKPIALFQISSNIISNSLYFQYYLGNILNKV